MNGSLDRLVDYLDKIRLQSTDGQPLAKVELIAEAVRLENLCRQLVDVLRASFQSHVNHTALIEALIRHGQLQGIFDEESLDRTFGYFLPHEEKLLDSTKRLWTLLSEELGDA